MANARDIGHVYSADAKRSDIEMAARRGYQDAKAGRAMSAEYEAQTDKWQRNYEIGRLWIASMRAAGIKPPAWPKGAARPKGFDDCLRKTRDVVGDIVPRGQKLPDDNAPLYALVPDVRHGRIIERVTL